MASGTLRSCGLNLKVTFLNESVSSSKRSFEECQEEKQTNTKRQCYTKLSYLPLDAPADPSSSISGIAAPTVCSVATNGHPDDSNTDDILDDSILDLSDGELSDSSIVLTREAEDELLLDSQPDCLETSNSIAFKPDSEHVGILCTLGSSEFSGTRDEFRKTEPLSPADPLVCSSPCRNDSGSPENGSNLSTGSQNQAGFGLDSNSSGLPEAVPVATTALNLEKGNNVAGVLDKEAAQAVGDDNLERVSQLMGKPERASVATEGPCEEQAQTKLGGVCANSPPQEAEGGLDSSDLHGEAAPSSSTSIGDQRKASMEGPSIKEPNCSISPRRRIDIREADLESSKEKYINHVLAHARRDELRIGAVNELYQLLLKVSAENHFPEPGSEHPTDLTIRNYLWRTNRTAHRCSLNEWFNRNKRNRRFEDVPDRFKRSPIPSQKSPHH